jgi:hypothetical protein
MREIYKERYIFYLIKQHERDIYVRWAMMMAILYCAQCTQINKINEMDPHFLKSKESKSGEVTFC